MVQMEESNKEFAEIVKVISAIGEKTKVINDIVFQTKLLSFNASVEAARAGEHGKGFAVVAEEVGNLASMSGKAATEISEMLGHSIKKVESIVESTQSKIKTLVEKGKEKLSSGIKTAEKCDVALDEVLENVAKVDEMISEIATASKEQSRGIQEITGAMSQLDQANQQNTDISQNSSVAATQLSRQAADLKEVVAQLMLLIEGDKENSHMQGSSDTNSRPVESRNVVAFKRGANAEMRKVPSSLGSKKVVGSDEKIPSANDPRFEEV